MFLTAFGDPSRIPGSLRDPQNFTNAVGTRILGQRRGTNANSSESPIPQSPGTPVPGDNGPRSHPVKCLLPSFQRDLRRGTPGGQAWVRGEISCPSASAFPGVDAGKRGAGGREVPALASVCGPGWPPRPPQGHASHVAFCGHIRDFLRHTACPRPLRLEQPRHGSCACGGTPSPPPTVPRATPRSPLPSAGPGVRASDAGG